MKNLLLLLSFVYVVQLKAQIITTVVGTGVAGFSGDSGQATLAELQNPAGITFDVNGNLYIADGYNLRVRKVSKPGIISTIAGNGIHGYSGDGGQASNAEFFWPQGVTFDKYGNLYITDYGSSTIRKVNTLGIITTVAGNGTYGYTGDGGQATSAQLQQPTNVLFDAMSNMYIADYQNNVIRKVNTAGIITTIAGNGQSGYSGDGGVATAAKMCFPQSIIFDSVGNLYIADYCSYVVRKVNTAGIISTVVGNGQNGYTGDGGLATAARLSNPESITFDKYENMYIIDNNNGVIRKVNTAGIISTVVGIHNTQGFSGDGGSPILAEINRPSCVVFDTSNTLYISDSNNQRIRKVTNIGFVGIKQITNGIELNIYPNPSNGSFVIEPNSTTKQTIQIFDVNGKVVLSQPINGKTNVDASILSEGVYNISLISNAGVSNKRLVIVK